MSFARETFEPGETYASAARQDRALAAWEIVSVVTTALIAEWCVFSLGRDRPWLVALPVVFAFAFMLISHRLRRETPRELGWRLDNFAEALRLLALPMVAFTVVLVTIGWLSSSIDFTRWRGGQSIFGMPALGGLWGLMQQYALQGFINRRAQVVWGRGVLSVTAVALIFGLLHLPNPPLMLATLVVGLIWAWVYQRAPNLPALALSHSLMTWVLASTLSHAALNGLRVGYKYFG